MGEQRKTAVDAIAEAWASIDGKLPQYSHERATGIRGSGHYEGYQTEAAELIKRLETRGFKVVPIEREHKVVPFKKLGGEHAADKER